MSEYSKYVVHCKKELKTIEDIESLSFEDFSFIDYKCHPSIKAEMAV